MWQASEEKEGERKRRRRREGTAVFSCVSTVNSRE